MYIEPILIISLGAFLLGLIFFFISEFTMDEFFGTFAAFFLIFSMLFAFMNRSTVEHEGNIKIISFEDKVIRYGRYSTVSILDIDKVYFSEGLDYIYFNEETEEIEVYVWSKDTSDKLIDIIQDANAEKEKVAKEKENSKLLYSNIKD